jgi:sugar transferase (PEP-CTERM/EpsH1 system associated)
MRILWLKSDLLVPLDKGGRLRTWHLLRHLAARHEISYLAFAESGTPASSLRAMEDVADVVETVTRDDAQKGSWKFAADAAVHLVDPLPYAVGKYRSREYARRVRRLLAERAFDAVVCDFLCPIVNLPRRVPCPTVLFTHNVESEIWRRHAETHTNPLMRVLYRQQYRRMLRFERRSVARFDLVLAVSDADRDTFARLYPGAIHRPAHVIPTGVDATYFTPSGPPSRADGRSIVFTGSMDWLPNEDAMLFFCREVLPLVRAAEPEATLSIVGRAPTPAVQRLAAEQAVHVTGRVDDVRPYLEDATVFAVPLRIGGGTRLKIFEAMAMGKAVVSTSVGAEGLDVVPNVHVRLADDPRSFADTIVALFRDVERRRQIEQAGRALVIDRYDWSAVAVSLEQALAAAVNQPPQDAVHAAWRPLEGR